MANQSFFDHVDGQAENYVNALAEAVAVESVSSDPSRSFSQCISHLQD